MLRLSAYIRELPELFPELSNELPWAFITLIQSMLLQRIQQLSSDFKIMGDVAIHKSAKVEELAILKGPIIISEDCFVAAHSYLRGGVFLGRDVSIGPGCEVKASLLFSNTALAHFNFVGDSLVGSDVNIEAGAVVANHFNERVLKEIEVLVEGQRVPTGTEKFGALIGDHAKLGANSVLSPGTILPPGSIVGRLQLIG
jgi:NDP-sugar pyrophosphorylase family protein